MNRFKSVFDVDGLLLKVCPVQLEICEFVNNFKTQSFGSRKACTQSDDGDGNHYSIEVWQKTAFLKVFPEAKNLTRFLHFV